jgi:hypothetical protein
VLSKSDCTSAAVLAYFALELQFDVGQDVYRDLIAFYSKWINTSADAEARAIIARDWKALQAACE